MPPGAMVSARRHLRQDAPMTPAPMTPQRSYAMPGMWVSEYTLEAPLDWRNPDGEQLQLFVRELVDPDRRDTDLPLATYLQGGPGGANPRPLTGAGGWLRSEERRVGKGGG